MDIFHMTFSTDGRRPLFANEAAQRRAVRTLARVAGAELVLFYFVDEHLHVVALSTRQRAGRLAQALYLALRCVTDAPLETARVRPVDNRRHLRWLVDYVLGQGPHHQLAHHPALWTGSCFQDLVGARYLDGASLQLGRVLPRLRLRDLMQAVGLPAEPLRPVAVDEITRLGLPRLVDAAATAAAVDPKLRGKTAPVIQAKQAVALLATSAGFKPDQIAAVLGVHANTARRLVRGDVHEKLTMAVRRRLALEEAVAATGRTSLNEHV